MQLLSLQLIYINTLVESDFPNRVYRSEKLMDSLQINPDINSKIFFTNDPNDRGYVSFNIVYCASITITYAVSLVSNMARRYEITDVAIILREIYKRAFKETKLFLGHYQQKT